jgi:hypothetical protein
MIRDRIRLKKPCSSRLFASRPQSQKAAKTQVASNVCSEFLPGISRAAVEEMLNH